MGRIPILPGFKIVSEVITVNRFAIHGTTDSFTKTRGWWFGAFSGALLGRGRRMYFLTTLTPTFTPRTIRTILAGLDSPPTTLSLALHTIRFLNHNFIAPNTFTTQPPATALAVVSMRNLSKTCFALTTHLATLIRHVKVPGQTPLFTCYPRNPRPNFLYEI
jgi:hypothetical protein